MPDLDAAWAEGLLNRELGGRMQARRGELIDALGDGGLVAMLAGEQVGLLCWRIEHHPEGEGDRPADLQTAEITCLVVEPGARGRGVGRALLEATEVELRAVGVGRSWLVTTNDNLAALALYQKADFRLSAVRLGALDASRRLKPSIPEIGSNGLPIRDELELERLL